MTISDAARILGQRGGQSRSELKISAARRNGQRGGRPKLTNAQIEKFAGKIVSEWRELQK